ncbi:MAG: 50S ribosomal protein L13 [Bdellovibrionales bacterium]|nr:50S ribosomal protein L13 [Bdellovibrionales bacterium]
MSTLFRSDKVVKAEAEWFIVDGADKTVGRIATGIASVLRGKRKPTFTPHQDCGDYVIVINADKLKFSGNKMDEKVYHRHTGYVGSVKSEVAKELQERKPGEILKKAVKGMLPKSHLGRKQLGNLRIYAGEEHPHAPQQPQPLSF